MTVMELLGWVFVGLIALALFPFGPAAGVCFVVGVLVGCLIQTTRNNKER